MAERKGAELSKLYLEIDASMISDDESSTCCIRPYKIENKLGRNSYYEVYRTQSAKPSNNPNQNPLEVDSYLGLKEIVLIKVKNTPKHYIVVDKSFAEYLSQWTWTESANGFIRGSKDNESSIGIHALILWGTVEIAKSKCGKDDWEYIGYHKSHRFDNRRESLAEKKRNEYNHSTSFDDVNSTYIVHTIDDLADVLQVRAEKVVG